MSNLHTHFCVRVLYVVYTDQGKASHSLASYLPARDLQDAYSLTERINAGLGCHSIRHAETCIEYANHRGNKIEWIRVPVDTVLQLHHEIDQAARKTGEFEDFEVRHSVCANNPRGGNGQHLIHDEAP